MAPSTKTDAHGFGKPSASSVIAEDVLMPDRTGVAAAPAGVGQTYRILITTQTDPYDTPVALAAAATFAAAIGDKFAGNDRKTAKLSISNAKTESFTDLKDLIGTLAADAKMIKHTPSIKKDATQGRVKEEDRKVRVSAFLYAASRENDNDFHLIIGRNPKSSPMYMTMEISGLPPKTPIPSPGSNARGMPTRNSSVQNSRPVISFLPTAHPGRNRGFAVL